MTETIFDIECRFFRDGERLGFNPASLVRAQWVLQESGGIGQIDVVTSDAFDALGFAPRVGDLVEVWAVGGGEAAPRARGKVAVPGRRLGVREERRITAFGRMQDMASVLMDKVVARYLGANLAEYAAIVLSDYARRRGFALGVDYVSDVQPCGVTLTEFSAADTTAAAAMQSLMDQASGGAVWGWEVDSESGLDLFYFRPRVASVGSQFFVGGSVKMVDATVESQALRNCVKIVGGAPKYPNLVKNSSFEAPTPPDGDSGNLLYAGGFEEGSDGGQGWTFLHGSSRNSEDVEDGGQHSSTAHTGSYYVILDHTASNNDSGQPAEEIWQEVPVAVGTTYSCSLYCARERGSTAAEGSLILEGRDSSGGVTESASLALAPASTVWTGGQDSTVLASDGLQIVTVFSNPATVKCRVRIIATANVSPNNGLLIDDVVLADASSVGQVGWIEKYPDHPATPGLAKFNWIDWASPLAAWEGVYGVRANVTADGGDKPILQLAPGDQPGGEYLFKPGPQQALVCGTRVKIDPGAPGNAGLASGIVHLEYKEWGADGSVNQSQNTQYTVPSDNRWRFMTVNPSVTSETYTAGQIAAPSGVQAVTAHGDAASATIKISFGASGTYDIDGVTARDAGSGEGLDPDAGVVYATSNYLRGDDHFERYVRVDDAGLSPYITDADVLGSIATYCEQEGLLRNDQIVDWNADARSYVAAWFSKWAVPIARPLLEVAHEAAQTPSPGSGRQVRVSGTGNDIPDTWPSRVTYAWERQRLAVTLELSDERPTLAKMLKALALEAASGGSGADTTLGGLLAQRYGGGGTGSGGSAGIAVEDSSGDLTDAVVSLQFARGTVVSPANGSAVWTPASASELAAGEVQLAPAGSAAAGLAVQGSDPRLADGRAPVGAAGGDLRGEYPNPTLVTVGAAGSYGDAGHYPVFTTDAQGRVTSAAAQALPAQAASLPPSGAAGGDLTGSYPNPALAAVVAAGTYGDGSHYPVITTDAKGRVTGVALQQAGSGFAPAAAAVAPASVAAGLVSYSGSSMLVQWHAALGAGPASGAVAFYGWQTSGNGGSSWTAEAFSLEGVYTGAAFGSGSQSARCRTYALTSSGISPSPSAWVASSSATAYSAPASTGGSSGLSAYYATSTSLASGATLTVMTSASDPFPYKRNARLFSRVPAPWLLAHFDGASGSTAATDATGNNTIAIGGSGAVSTAQSKFGGASFYPGASGYADIGNSSAWDVGSSNFTLECWVYYAVNSSANQIIFDRRPVGTSSGVGFVWYIGSSGYLNLYLGSTSGSWALQLGGSGAGLSALTANAWNHVAICRSGSTIIMGLNGSVASAAYSGAVGAVTGTNPRAAGSTAGNGTGFSPILGYLDELRFMPGQAVYAAAYTIPSLPFAAVPIDVPIVSAPIAYADASGANSATATTFTNNTGSTISAVGIVVF